MEIAEVRPELVRALKDGVEAAFGYPGSPSVDYYAKGISLVLKAFHVESDYRLISDLGKLTDQDIAQVKQSIAIGLRTYEGEHNVFNKALNFPRIPATQGFLREIIEKPKDVSLGYDDRYKAGAGVMYRAMEVIWSRLYPGQTPPSESPSTPPPQQSGPQFSPPSGLQ